MKKKKRLVERTFYYDDQSAVANRKVFVIAVLALTFMAGMIVGGKVDRTAESVSMQPVKKAEWAVAYSKENGDYPF